MGLKKYLKIRYHISKDKKELNAVERKAFEVNNLRTRSDLSFKNLFESPEIESIWKDSKKEIDIFSIPDGSGGVNPGDRKALYYLISKLKPSTVLEVGTHIGASILHIASALYMSQIKDGKKASIISVDIADVNSTTTKPWLAYGTKYSPIEMINQLNYGSFVSFVTDTSLHYAANSQQKFDFIFLDGSHAANIVYQEVPLALKLLNPNGVILLHDYFPKMKSLWSDGTIIPGPYLATERFIKEGINLIVVPLRELPWPTKQGSNVTSLALLLRNQ